MAQYDLHLIRNDHATAVDFTEIFLAKPDVTGKYFTQNPTTGVFSWAAVAWSEISGKPSIFSPATHNHAIADTSGLQSALDGKEATITTLSVAKGGTGSSTFTAGALLKGNGTSALAVAVANTDYITPSGSITGNAGTATKLSAPRTINGISFDGSANITINAVDSTPRIAASEKGAVNGIATLDASGFVSTTQLPSYVDDVMEFANLAGFPGTGETAKIYVAKDTNKTYRWSGSAYVFITSGAVDSVAGKTGVVTLVKADVGLGSVDNTADADKPVSSAATTALALKAPLASPAFTGTVTGITSAMVGLGNVNNTADSAKPVSTAQQTALDLKAPLASPTFTGTVSGITKSMVGLANVDNTADSAKPVSTAQATAIALKADLASPTFTGTVSGITKSMVGLSNVDNTADASKPVSTAQATAIAAKLDTSTYNSFIATVVTKIGTLPGSISAAGTKDQMYFDTNYLYCCVASNTWKRIPLANF
jgi:hypothetical protein